MNKYIGPRSAEDILPGHPDRLCDAVAERLVQEANWWDAEALAGIEVALHRHKLYITGRIAASSLDFPGMGPEPIVLDQNKLENLVSEELSNAGYKETWKHIVSVETDLDIGELSDEERSIRKFSDDQGIATGYADPKTPTLLPLEVHAVRLVKNALSAAQKSSPDLLGPDGKVLVRLSSGERPSLEYVNLAIQHIPGLGFEDLYRLVVPFLEEAFEDLQPLLDPPKSIIGDAIRLNGIGDFTCGGPLGDNGLSGKKLVVDHYGPHVPIGGGAICGKDAHKPDRVGALRARQIACRLAVATGGAASVHLGFLPGLESPDRVWANLENGVLLDADAISEIIPFPDCSLAGSARDLELASQPWPEIMRKGYMGNNWGWER